MPAARDLGFVQVTEPEYGVFAEDSREELRMVGSGVQRGSDEALADSQGGRLGAARDAEFGVETRRVRRNCAPADKEGVGNLAIGLAGNEQPQHVLLARGEPERASAWQCRS
jgi:hypothetical protein